MSNFRDVWGGFVIMVYCCILGLVLALAGGMVIDRLYTGLDNMDWFDDADPDWSGDDWGDLHATLNLYYWFCMAIPLVGVACFVKSVLARQGYDQYLNQ
jgi:hypothetical protein